MDNRYDSAEDVNMRLNHSVVKYEDKFFYVSCDGMNIILTHLVTNTPIHRISANSAKLDVSSPELGYVNLRVPAFISRMPVRRQKQGCAVENLSFRQHGRSVVDVVNAATFRSQEFLDMLEGKYPKFAQCLTSPNKSYAFHRDFLVEKFKERTDIYFKEKRIATKTPKEQRFALEEDFDNTIMRMKLEAFGVAI